MTSSVFASILALGFSVAFLHGAMPNHWLPFVLVGRRQGWPWGKTLLITALAGLCHAAVTMALGLLVVGLGMAAAPNLGSVLPMIAGGLLVALGLFYLVRHSSGGGHLHLPLIGRLAPAYGSVSVEGAAAVSDRTAILGLLAILALSPCEAFVPVYVSGLRYGWLGFAALSGVLTLAAVASMTALTGLSMAGARWLGFKSTERYEGLVMGAALVALGVLVMVLEG